MHDFYIPLVDLKFDIDRIRNELEAIVKPSYQSYALTVTEELANDNTYDFSQYNSITQFDEYGIRRFPDGTLDTDLIYYPACLQNSYIKEVEIEISNYLGLHSPRVRFSKAKGSTKLEESLKLHTDPHTPYRVHLALETMPMHKWRFKNKDTDCTIHQPANGIPYLVEVANTEHAVILAPRMVRYHIWFQYHKPVSKEFLDLVLNKAHNK